MAAGEAARQRREANGEPEELVGLAERVVPRSKTQCMCFVVGASFCDAKESLLRMWASFCDAKESLRGVAVEKFWVLGPVCAMPRNSGRLGPGSAIGF